MVEKKGKKEERMSWKKGDIKVTPKKKPKK